ncbi:MAG: RluA family pseudouridine synthase, partial [Deltaproteobacteria bacterium]
MRLIDLLRERGLSRGDARRALKSGKVLLDGVPTADEGRIIDDPGRVRVDPNQPRRVPGRDLVILHRDPGFVVVWKPAGLLSVPAPRQGGQKNALAAVRRACGAGLPVHRLDEQTSGLMLVALDERHQLALKELLERHEVERGYRALVSQHFPKESWSIESELLRDRGDGLRGSLHPPAPPGRPTRPRRVHPPPDQDTRRAVTHVALVENLARDAALVAARLETGRTHQVRIHLAEIGHPVLGDPLYAPRRVRARAPRLCLHACRLAFPHPVSGEAMVFEAPLADDMDQLRRALSHRDPPDARPRGGPRGRG